jgi:uncharacterized protein (DUF1501 family)
MRHLRRREFLRRCALAAAGAALAPHLTLAAPSARRPRFVLILLRGALDGLAAVPPYGDRDYAALRGEVALHAPGNPGGALRLDDTFGLHPALAFLAESYQARELIVLHAVATAYRERSHFDGQDLLENGSGRPHALESGWLNRALAQLPPPLPREAGVALGQNVPLVMRGAAAVTSWSPSTLGELEEDTLARLTDLYAGDALLAGRLADGLAATALVAQESLPMEGTSAAPPAMAVPRAVQARYAQVVQAAAGFLREEEGPRVAVLDTGGWDTHANEGGAEGQLAARLRSLDGGLSMLKRSLGPAWSDTAVLLVTEFGRTAAVNGTRGTDHGTGSAAFLLGGAVAGGRVLSDWPGLASRALYQGRDLQPTLDLRALFKGVLAEHLGIAPRSLESAVFPDSAAARPLRGLMRS